MIKRWLLHIRDRHAQDHEVRLEYYLERNEIPWLPSAPGEFEAFFTERRKALAQRIARLLGTGATAATGEGAAQAADVAGTMDDELAVSDDE
jgi:hypothetical protein